MSSVTPETFLDNDKIDISRTRFHPVRDNLPPNERVALHMRLSDKIKEGLDLLQNPLHYRVLSEPIVDTTVLKARQIVSDLHSEGFIDLTTFKYLNLTQTPPPPACTRILHSHKDS